MRIRATRALRAVLGGALVLVSYPLVLAGVGLWVFSQHRDPDGAFRATTQGLHTGGYALVVDDVDTLLRRSAPFARGGQTELCMSVTGPGGPLFLGLAPRAAVHRYLAGVAITTIERVRPATGQWPVDTSEVPGLATPTGAPLGQDFWVATGTGLTRDGVVEDPLSWTPSAVRGQHLSLVVMNADASRGIDVSVSSTVTPGWLVPMVWGMLASGGTLLVLGLTLLAWPPVHRTVVYQISDEQLRGLAERLRPHIVSAERQSKPEQRAEPPAGVPEPEPQRCAAAPGRSGPPRTWAALLASARPPATPRLLWPPKRAERPTTPPRPALPGGSARRAQPREIDGSRP